MDYLEAYEGIGEPMEIALRVFAEKVVLLILPKYRFNVEFAQHSFVPHSVGGRAWSITTRSFYL